MQRTNFVSIFMILMVAAVVTVGAANLVPDETTEKVAEQFLCDGPAGSGDRTGGIVPDVRCVGPQAVVNDASGNTADSFERFNTTNDVTWLATGVLFFMIFAVMAIVMSLLARWFKPAKPVRRRPAGPMAV